MDIKNAEKVFSNKQIIPTIEKVEESAKGWTRKKKVVLPRDYASAALNFKTGGELYAALNKLNEYFQFTIKMYEVELPKHISLVTAWIDEASKRKTYVGTQSGLDKINKHHDTVTETLLSLATVAEPRSTEPKEAIYNEAVLREMTAEHWDDPIEKLINFFPCVYEFHANYNDNGYRDIVFDKNDIKNIKATIETILKNYEKISSIISMLLKKTDRTFAVFNDQLQVFIKRFDGMGKLKAEAEAIAMSITANLEQEDLTEGFKKRIESSFSHNFLFLSKVITEVIILLKHTNSFIFSSNA